VIENVIFLLSMTETQQKLKLVQEQNPTIRLVILTQDCLKSMGIILPTSEEERLQLSQRVTS